VQNQTDGLFLQHADCTLDVIQLFKSSGVNVAFKCDKITQNYRS